MAGIHQTGQPRRKPTLPMLARPARVGTRRRVLPAASSQGDLMMRRQTVRARRPPRNTNKPSVGSGSQTVGLTWGR